MLAFRQFEDLEKSVKRSECSSNKAYLNIDKASRRKICYTLRNTEFIIILQHRNLNNNTKPNLE
jgi:hypothetical protein